MISQNISSIPSDLRDYLCVGYSYSKITTELPKNREKFKTDLHNAISDVIQTGRVDSPVLHYMAGRARNWREDQIVQLKNNYVVADYIFATFDHICEIVTSLKAVADSDLSEFAIRANAPLLYYQLETFENAIMDLKVGVDSPELYRNYQTAKMQVAAIRRRIAMQGELAGIINKLSPETGTALSDENGKILKSQYVDYFALERGDFEQIEFENIFKAESDLDIEFLELLDENLQNSAIKLNVSEDEINRHLEIEEP